METKDTVTSACKLCSSATNQADISFKAGIKEVVEWLKANDAVVHPYYGKAEWHAQLKKWGIEKPATEMIP